MAGDGGALAGIGGTVRNLAAAAELHEDLPSFGVQGFPLRKEVLDELVDELADMTPAERAKVPGIKPERGDLILAGALVVQSVMEAGGFDCMEVTEAGLREGVFFASLLDGRYPPLIENVREHSVRNLAAQYHADPPTPSTWRSWRCRCGTRSAAATRRSASCCGRPRCCTTSARRSTTTTTTSTRAI